MCWGDSLTHQGGMPTRLAEVSGRVCHNAGVGGENSLGIAARQGAMPYLLTAPGGTIPAAGAVDVTVGTSFVPATGSYPLLAATGVPTGDGAARGTLGGVRGVLRLRVKDSSVDPLWPGPGDVYEFARDADGPPVPLARPTPFCYDFARDRRDDLQIVWMGENGPDEDTTVAMFEAIAISLPAGTPFLFLTSTGPIHPEWTDTERRLIARWGRRFVNVRRYLIDEAPEDLGMPLTAADRNDRTRGRVPGSLRTDDVHHTMPTQRAIAEFLLLPRLRELGWAA